MPFERPTLTALARQARADLASATGSYAILRASPLAILAKVLSGLVHGVYGYLDWIARMSVPWTAEGVYFLAWAALVGITRGAPAFAAATATFAGTPGAILPEGTRLARSADGVAYATAALGTVGTGGTVTVPIAAVEAGAAGNALLGAEVALTGAVAGVNAVGTLAPPAARGAAEEGWEGFRARGLARYAAPPQGGTLADYEGWARDVPGVTRAWASLVGPGTVAVHVMLDDARAASGGFPVGGNGGAAAEARATPATGDQALVANALYPLRPATAVVLVQAPNAYPIALTITDLAGDTTEIRAAITAALRGMFRRLDRARPAGTIYQSDLTGAIDGVAGVTRYTLASPTAPSTAPAGSLPVLGAVTWPT